MDARPRARGSAFPSSSTTGRAGPRCWRCSRRLGRPRRRRGSFTPSPKTRSTGGRPSTSATSSPSPGMITFRAAENIREAAAGLPLEAMLVETDTPFLAPCPTAASPASPPSSSRRRRGWPRSRASSLEAVARRDDGELRSRALRPGELHGASLQLPSSRISPQRVRVLRRGGARLGPAAFRQYLENIVVVVEEEPAEEDYDETDTPDDEELFGIFRGIPYFERGPGGHGPARPDRDLPRADPALLRDARRGGPGDPRHRRPRDRPHARPRGRGDAVLSQAARGATLGQRAKFARRSQRPSSGLRPSG